jgi:hypothetical protein
MNLNDHITVARRFQGKGEPLDENRKSDNNQAAIGLNVIRHLAEDAKKKTEPAPAPRWMPIPN